MAEKAEILVASLKAETLHLRAELDSLRWSFEDVLKLEVSAQTGSSDILPTSSHVGYSRWETALQQQKPKKGVRVYVSCVADLMHIGHARLFEKCRAFGDEVIAGVHSDAVATSYKRKPVINEKHRYYLVGSNMHIDHVLEDAPLKQTKEFLDANGIDIVVRATDGGAEIVDQFHEVPFREGMIRFVPRTEGLSTSDIISKVARDYADELVNPIVQGNKVVDVTSGGSSNN